MTRRVDEPKPMDPRLAQLPAITARKLAQLPPVWLNQLLEGTK